MERDQSRFSSSGRRSGSPRAPKPIKHTLHDATRGVKFEVFSTRKLTPDEVSAAVKKWLGAKEMKELTPWRTYRIEPDAELE